MEKEKVMDDLISRRAAIDALDYGNSWEHMGITLIDRDDAKRQIEHLPSAQPEISRIEQELYGKTPEEQYEFLYWLLLKFGLAYTDSKLAVIEWLRGEEHV